LLAALPDVERPVWATAFYAGLRLGELRALRWGDVDLILGEIHVEWSWCNQTRQLVAPKSRAGTRTVPIPAVLRPHIAAQRLRTYTGPDGFVFARRDGAPFEPSTVYRHARTAWNATRDQHDQPTLHPVTPHEARHTFASLMIAAGVNPKTLSDVMGHASITITLDRYGHLFPGSRHQAANLLDAYLAN
jgi:integrase